MPSRKTATATIIAIAAVFIALACAPAAPAPQGEDPKPTPEPTQQPTNTPETVIIYQNNTPIPVQLFPEPLTESIFKDNLQSIMERFEATREAHERSGRSAETLDDPAIGVSIKVDSPEKVDRLAEWLQSRPTRITYTDKRPERGMGISARIRISLLKELSELEWIESVQMLSGGSINQGDPSSPTIDLNQAQGITAWRNAGITGAGVEVGIIDAGFEDQRSFKQTQLTTSSTRRRGTCRHPKQSEPP